MIQEKKNQQHHIHFTHTMTQNPSSPGKISAFPEQVDAAR
jgi:hypothetical protein